MTENDQKPTKAQQYNINKRQKRLRGATGKAIADYNMIEEGDKVMVCLSGGKDSYVMLDILISLQRSAPVSFELIAVNIDKKHPGHPSHILPEYLEDLGVPYMIVEEDIHTLVNEKLEEGKMICSLCSRLRRGIIYRTAKEIGATKIALGHHRDDILETLFLNMFHGGKLKGMPAKLISDDGENIVIRPLAYCREKDIIKYANVRDYPIIPGNLCGIDITPNSQRESIKEMLNMWDKRHPGRLETMFRAMQNVVPSHLADTELYDFKSIAKKEVVSDSAESLTLDVKNL